VGEDAGRSCAAAGDEEHGRGKSESKAERGVQELFVFLSERRMRY
jgi:hypothetical protein